MDTSLQGSSQSDWTYVNGDFEHIGGRDPIRTLDKYRIIELRGIPSIISALCSRCRREVYQGISDIQSPSSECPEMTPTMSIIYFSKFSGLECMSE